MVSNDASPEAKIFRTPLGQRLLSLFVVIVLGAASACLTALAAYSLIVAPWWLVGLAVAMACFVAGLTGYVWRDLRGKWRLRVSLEADALILDLPSGRSLIHRPAELHVRIPYEEIEAIESRLEGYRTFGMAMMQRAYVLRRKDGGLIFLFEDRAIGTSYESKVFTSLAAEIAARANAPLRDVGMAEGQGGVLGVWGTQASDWAAPPLPLRRQRELWRVAAITGALPIPIIMIALLIRLLSGGM